MPGRRDSSVAKSSMADTPRSEGQLERKVESTHQLSRVVLRGVRRLLLRVGDGYHHEVLEHLDVGWVHHSRVELDLLDLARASDLNRHHAAARGAGHGNLLELILNLL